MKKCQEIVKVIAGLSRKSHSLSLMDDGGGLGVVMLFWYCDEVSGFTIQNPNLEIKIIPVLLY